ncbi:MAG: nucleotidyltransferase [Candidatus Scalindua rubra]|uniref:Nucleotidyltransferase n=1 Tax=Candidatus Scalindua rubra TaxID=1872076 RepID=A0A1E3XF19_9BACT|nr:MAG: nucleotidyltransferase [Candidatus Scalindua rubra]
MKRSELLNEIENIKKQLIEKYKPEKIILFGSSVWGDNEINDIDFFIIKRDVPYYGAERLIELYKLIKATAAVDYIVYKPEEAEECLTLGDPFVKKIYSKGKVLYG